jgi:microcystin-dependent protein
MPRNSQGLYTLPLPPVVPNTLIEASWANPTLDDIASALTASIPRDGSAPMTGQLTLATGDPTNARHATSKAYVDRFMAYATGMPLGAVFPFAPNAVPAGYLLCDGQAVPRATYPDLFAAIGTTFGAGDGVATFNVPDLRDWFVRGRNPSTRAIGSKQDASLASHNHTVSDPGHNHAATQASHSHTLSVSEHTHGVNDPGHVHGGNRAQGASSTFQGAGFNNGIEDSAAAVTGISIALAAVTASADFQQPTVTVQSAQTGVQVGAAGGAETVPQNVALDYYIKAVNDSVVSGIVTSIDTSDASMIAIDATNPVVPILSIQSNLPFGIPKLDLNGQLSISQLPAGVQTFLGTFDCSGGQNPSEAFPAATFVNGNTYLVAVGGTITVYDPATNTAAPTVIDLGWNLVWVSNTNQPVGWYFIESPVVTAATAASVAFVPAGTIAATNVQAAIQELDSETQTALSGKATLGNLSPAMNGIAAPGVATVASRGDHVHPVDTSRAPASAGTAIGTTFTPAAGIAATNVQAAIEEVVADVTAPKSGDILQIVTHFDAGTGVSASTWTNLTTVAAIITPKSTNSTLIVEAFATVSVPNIAGVNAQAVFQIYSGTFPAGNIGIYINPWAPSAAGGVGVTCGAALMAVVSNTSLTSKAYGLAGAPTTGIPNLIGAVQQAWKITEVQN